MGGDPLPAGQVDDGALVHRLHGRDLLTQTERHPEVAEVVLEAFHDLVVAEVEQAPALVDHRHLRPQRGKDRGVLDPDHPSAHDDQRPGDAVHLQQLVGVEHGLAVELHGGRPEGPGPDGDHDVLRCDLPRASTVGADLQGVWIDEARGTLDHGHVVAGELVLDHVGLSPDDVLVPGAEVVDRDLLLHPVALAVHAALGEPGEVEDGLAERLRRDGPADHAHAAHLAPLGDGGALPQLGGLDGGLLAGGPAADRQQVVFEGHRRSLQRGERSRIRPYS